MSCYTRFYWSSNLNFSLLALRKKALQPPKPMKPLYWTRIVAPTKEPVQPAAAVPTSLPSASITAIETSEVDATITLRNGGPIGGTPTTPPFELWQHIEETSLENLDEFTELFSRRAVVPKPAAAAADANAANSLRKTKPIKVLDSKRSQSVGIFSRSLHFDFAEIEHAINCCDTSVVSLEALTKLMEIKATDEEIEAIRAVATTLAAENDSAPQQQQLDKPEQFLLKISNLSCSAERISCIVFQVDFDEGCIGVSRKLDTIRRLCDFLLYSDELRHLFSIILTLGNYMNGGNHVRGQADGFGLEILAKLKDVKSSDSRLTLLHFIVKTYIDRCRKAGTPLQDVQLPIPDPGDVVKTLLLDFQELKAQVVALQQKVVGKFGGDGGSLKIIKHFFTETRILTASVLVRSTPENMEPFSSQMETFLSLADKRTDKLLRKLADNHGTFMRTLKYYKYVPKSGPLADCTPGQFFELWSQFTNDFREIWKKEMVMLNNEM